MKSFDAASPRTAMVAQRMPGRRRVHHVLQDTATAGLMLSLELAAERLGMIPADLRALVAAGHVPSIRVGGCVLVDADAASVARGRLR